MRNKILSVIVAALLSAQAQDGGWNSGGPTEDYGVMGVVESGQHTQWGSLRYPVRPGEYTVIGELIEGGGVVGIPQVRNPRPQVDAERVQESVVEYTPSRDPNRGPPEGASGAPLILLDPDTRQPLAYFNNEQEARYHLGDRLFNDLRSQDNIRVGDPGALPHYANCTSEDCREISMAAAEFRAQDRYIAERALEGFLETVREVAQAIADFVRDVVQAVVDFFAGLFDWVENAVAEITGDNNSGSGSGSGGGSGSGSGDNGGGSGDGSGSGSGSGGSGGSSGGSGGGDDENGWGGGWSGGSGGSGGGSGGSDGGSSGGSSGGSGGGSGSGSGSGGDDPPPPPGESLTE